MLGSGAQVFGASLFLSVCGFVFHAIASRRLGVGDYGSLYALLSLYTLASMPVGLVSPVIAKYAAEFRALHDVSHMRGLLDFVAKWFAGIGALCIVAGIAFAPWLAAYLHTTTWAIPVIGLMVALGMGAGALRALAQGTHEFAGFGWSMVGEGLGKVVVIAALSAGVLLTVFTGVVGFAAGIVIALLVMAVPLLRRFGRVKAAPIALDWSRILATTGGAASISIAMALIGSADVVLVRHSFGAHEAGLYSAASLSGKILLYFVSFVPTVLIPHAADRHARGERTRETIGFALAFVTLAGFIGVIAFKFLGITVLHALVGTQFDAAAPLLIGYGSAMALLAITSAFAAYGIATHRLLFAIPLLAGTALTLLCIAFVHPSLQAVVSELVIGNCAIVASVALVIAWQGARSLK